MLKQTATTAAWLGCLFSASAQDEVRLADRSRVIPEFDVARAAFSYEGDTDYFVKRSINSGHCPRPTM
jgi:hypothetical protein